MITKLLSYSAEAEVLGRVHLVLFEDGKLVIAGLSLDDSHAVLRALSLGKLVAAELPQASPHPTLLEQASLDAMAAQGAAEQERLRDAHRAAGEGAVTPKDFLGWAGTWCGAPGCGKKQFDSPGGVNCEAGHGGAPAVSPPVKVRPTLPPAAAAGAAPPAGGPTPSPEPLPAPAAAAAPSRSEVPPAQPPAAPATVAEFDEPDFGPPQPVKPAPAGYKRDDSAPMTAADKVMPAWAEGDGPPALGQAKNLKDVLKALVDAGFKTEEALLAECVRLKDRLPIVATIADLPKRVHTACSAYAEMFGLQA